MNVIARTLRSRTVLISLALALAFAVAACASQKSAPKRPEAAQPQASTTRTPSEQPAASQSTAETAAASEQQAAMTAPGTGERVEIRRSWVQVRSQPDANAKAIALVFGNDQLEVEGTEGDWIRVRLGRNRSGWIPVAATERP